MPPDGMVVHSSEYGPEETIVRLRAAIVERGIAILAHIDHAAAAAGAGLQMRPSDLVIFGSATAGTPLMQAAPTIGIDLPLKALVWSDDKGFTWLAVNDPGWLAARHGIGPDNHVVAGMAKVLAAIASQATRHEAAETENSHLILKEESR